MWRTGIKALAVGEAGTRRGEGARFACVAFLTGGGFVCFSAGQLLDASSLYAGAPVPSVEAARL